MQDDLENNSIMNALTSATFFTILSSLAYSCLSASIKYMTNIHPIQLFGYEFGAVACLNLPQMVWRNENFLGPPGCRGIVTIRAIAAAAAGLFHYIALSCLPLGESTVLVSTFPALSSIAAKVFMKESFGLLHIISIISTIAGMILVTGMYQITNATGYSVIRIFGFVAAFLTVIFTTASILLTRRLKDVHYSVLSFTGGVVAVIEVVIYMLNVGEFNLPYRGLEQFLIICMGFLSYITNLGLIIAMRKMQLGLVTIVRPVSLICFAFTWQIIIFGDEPDIDTILGAVLVCFAVALIAFSKQLSAFLPKACENFC